MLLVAKTTAIGTKLATPPCPTPGVLFPWPFSKPLVEPSEIAVNQTVDLPSVKFPTTIQATAKVPEPYQTVNGVPKDQANRDQWFTAW